jgi:hypothetical protein
MPAGSPPACFPLPFCQLQRADGWLRNEMREPIQGAKFPEDRDQGGQFALAGLKGFDAVQGKGGGFRYLLLGQVFVKAECPDPSAYLRPDSIIRYRIVIHNSPF